jgi:hypothetical protein
MKHVFLFILIFLAGCGKLDANTTDEKPFFSVWVSEEFGVAVDLRKGDFGSPLPINFVLPGGPICGCQIILQGNGNEGMYSVSSCQFVGTGAPHAYCSLLDETGTYAKGIRQLMFCELPNSCAFYR